MMKNKKLIKLKTDIKIKNKKLKIDHIKENIFNYFYSLNLFFH